MHLVWLNEHPKLTNMAETLAIRGSVEEKRKYFGWNIEEFETNQETEEAKERITTEDTSVMDQTKAEGNLFPS